MPSPLKKKGKRQKKIKAYACLNVKTDGEEVVDELHGLPVDSEEIATVMMIYNSKDEANLAKKYYSIYRIVPVTIIYYA